MTGIFPIKSGAFDNIPPFHQTLDVASMMWGAVQGQCDRGRMGTRHGMRVMSTVVSWGAGWIDGEYSMSGIGPLTKGGFSSEQVAF